MSGHNSDLMDNSRASAIALNRLDYFCLFAASSIALVKGGAELFFGLCVLFGCWLWAKGSSASFSSDAKPIVYAMFSFLALKLLSAAWAPNVWLAFKDFGTHSHWLALFPVVVALRRVPNLGESFLQGLGIAMVVCCAWALYQTPNISKWGIDARFVAGTGNALILAAFATVNSALFFTLLFPTKLTTISVDKWKVWIFYFASVFVVVATFSRMPMIAIVVLSLFIALSFKLHWKGDMKMAIVITVLVLGAVAIVFEQTNVGNRFKSAAHEIDRFNEKADKTTSVGIRMAMQQSAIDAIKKAPLFGSGAGSAMQIAKESSAALFGKNGENPNFRHLHNQYLQITVEQGIVGLAMFVLIGVFAIRFFWKSKDFFVHQAGISFILAYALLGLTNISVKQGALNSFFVLILALLIVLAERDSKNIR
jgi:O-antigen ligase